jgi:hypothetical protein
VSEHGIGKRISIAMVMVLVLAVAGCAVGNRHEYGTVVADFRASGSYPVAVATLDQRDYVLSLNKSPNFVGLQRGGYGNPFDVITEDGKPLSDNVTAALANSLKAKGFVAVRVETEVRDTSDTAVKKLMGASGSRTILLTLREWKTDTYMNVALHYNTLLEVRDPAGTVLATVQIEGKDNLGGSAWNPPAVAKEAAPRALKEKLERLLNDPRVVKVMEEP